MGNEINNSNVQRIRDRFNHMFRNNYRKHSVVLSETYGQITLFENINNKKKDIMMKQIHFKQQNDIKKLIKTLQIRIQKPIDNLTSIYDIQHYYDKNFCGSEESIRIYAEHLQRSLKKQLRKRRKIRNYRFGENQLWKILRSMINAIAYLHGQGTFHGEIKFDNLMIDQHFHVKLIEKALLNPTNWQIVYLDQSVKMVKGKGILFSPTLFKCMQHNRMQIVCYDPYKGDIFALGMIMLQCCSLQKAEDFYDYETFKVNYPQIKKILQQLRKKYSWELVNLLEKMLEQEDDFRPTAESLKKSIDQFTKFGKEDQNMTLNQSLLASFYK